MADWTLLRPWWLLALGLPLLLVYWHWRQHHTGQNFIRQSILRYLRGQQQNEQQRPVALWLLLPWVFGVLALSGPAHRQADALYQTDDVWIWMLDTSRSMLADDVPPSRLLNSRYQLFNLLEQSQGQRIALIAFAGDAYVITPPTDDHQTLKFLLRELEPDVMPVGGSDPLAAIQLALEMVDHHPGQRVRLLLVTDDLDARQGKAIASLLQPRKLPIDILVAGTQSGAPIRLKDGSLFKDRQGQLVVARSNLSQLATLAHDSGGQLVRTDANLANIDSLLQTPHGQGQHSGQQQLRPIDLGYWLMVPLLLLVFAFRRGWFFLICLAVSLSQAPHVEAGEGMELYRQGEFVAAAEAFTDPLWRGNAWFRAGRYADAAAAYQEAGDAPEALYNLGNALAQQQEFAAALEAYDHALRLDPNLHDALYNRTLVARWLQQQQAQQSKSQQAATPKTAHGASSGDLLDLVAEEPGNLMKNRLRLQQQRRLKQEPAQTW